MDEKNDIFVERTAALLVAGKQLWTHILATCLVVVWFFLWVIVPISLAMWIGALRLIT